MTFSGNTQVVGNDLTIGGLKVTDLAKKYQTPLYVFDEAALKKQIQTFIDNFKSDQFETHIIYASKAFTNLYMMGLVEDYGLHVDVVSAGEIFIALKAGVNPSHMYFHGNNKSPKEISLAIENDVGTFVVDNMLEFDHIARLAKEQDKVVRTLLRINPGIEADTHKYIKTTTENSKFGISTRDANINEYIQQFIDEESIDFAGFHCHIGSQVKDVGYFYEEAETVIKFAKEVSVEQGIDIEELNLGGGFGVAHSEDEESIDYPKFLQQYIQGIETALEDNELNIQTISVEPGRALINNAGSTLYTLGGVKDTGVGYPFALIDGGMSDNIRPALYQASYTAYVGNKMAAENHDTYRVAGKLCETGDILIEEVNLPKIEQGDVLVVPASGAYTYTMSSHYNMLQRPAVIFVEDGEARVAVKRESFDDLINGQSTY